MKVCFLISYYSPDYVRGASLIAAIENIENIENIELKVAKNRSRGLKRYFETLKQFFSIRFNQNPDIYIIGFRGLEIWPIVRIFTIGKTLILDELMSPYDSLHNDQREGLLGKLISYLIYPLEYVIYHLSDYILTDTNLHNDYFRKTFKINEKKLKQIYVSSPQFDISHSREPQNPLNIFFYGNFHPLHGVDLISEAIYQTEDLPVKYTIVGGGDGNRLEQFMNYLKQHGIQNVEHIKWLEWDALMKKASEADLCLGGPFGNTSQSQKIITGKTFQFISLGKPTIVGEINEDNGFIDKKNCLLVKQGSATEISETIRWATENNDKLTNIGKEGRDLFEARFSINSNSKRLAQLFEEIRESKN